jgi:hypothetical protein
MEHQKEKQKRKEIRYNKKKILIHCITELDGFAIGAFVMPMETKLPMLKEGVVLKTKVSRVEDTLPLPSKITLESSATSKGKQKKK